jgi:hypothetical protein
MEKQRMTQADQSVLIWPVLAFAARTQQVLSYSDVQGFTGIAAVGLHTALGLIHAHCRRHKLPLLNSIVVNRETGLPGEGFPEKMTPTDVLVEQTRVFVFDWAGHDKLRPQDFQSS